MPVSPLLIGFCYAFVAGIAAARVLPVPPSAGAPLFALAALAFAAGGAVLARVGRRGWAAAGAGARAAAWAAVLGPGLALGLARQGAVDTAVTRRVAHVRVDGRSAELAGGPVALPEMARVALRKESATGRDLRLRLQGEVHARVLERDAAGIAALDERGRWPFTVAELPQRSDEVLVRARDPVGTVYPVAQPFTRVDRVEVVGDGEEAALSLHAVANHVATFARETRPAPPVRILGRVTGDPAVYPTRTVLTVTPAFLQESVGGPWYRIDGGDLHVEVRPEAPDYGRYAGRWAYGMDLEVAGELLAPRPQPFPGGFDARAFLRNHGVHGRLFPRRPVGDEGPALRPAPLPDGRLRRGAPHVVASLALRDRMLGVIKQTAPFPQSAFLGGVTLGLRHGLQGVRFEPDRLFRAVPPDEWEEDAEEDAEGEMLLFEQFRASGVNHVLAVSGLHVTILALLFAGIFSLLRIPRKVFVPVVILVLLVFAILTGARPSTVRAVIMHTLFLLAWAYLGQGLRASALLGVPVAALLILLHNPWMITDPSFTLSFGAILSLALLTPPVLALIEPLRGPALLAALTLVGAVTGTGILAFRWLATPAFALVAAAAAAAAWRLGRGLERRGTRLFGGRGLGDLPGPVTAFLAAQIGIQAGMMLPLSAYYFNRWAFGGAYANLVAIPLIGVVLQLSILAGLLGFVPGVGMTLALVMNAANGLFTALFLLLARGVAALFPFPFLRRPLLRDLVAWYAALAVVIWRAPLGRAAAALGARLGGAWPRLLRAWPAAAAVLLALPLAVGRPRPEPGLRVTVLPLGYASAVLVETPAGHRVLVDSGFADATGRRNDALRSILPFLSDLRIRDLDAVVLLSGAPERAAGLPSLLRHARVERVLLPAGLHPAAVGAGAARRPPVEVRAGDVLHAETWRGLPVRIEAVGHGATDRGPAPGLAVRVRVGDRAVLLAGDLGPEAQRALAEAEGEGLRADVLLAPGRAAGGPEPGAGKADVEAMLAGPTAAFLAQVQPSTVILEFGNPRPVLGRKRFEALRRHALGRRFYRQRVGPDGVLETDRDLAVFIRLDEDGVHVDTQAARLRASAQRVP